MKQFPKRNSCLLLFLLNVNIHIRWEKRQKKSVNNTLMFPCRFCQQRLFRPKPSFVFALLVSLKIYSDLNGDKSINIYSFISSIWTTNSLNYNESESPGERAGPRLQGKGGCSSFRASHSSSCISFVFCRESDVIVITW